MAAATLTFPSQTLLKNVVDPVDGTDAATKEYVDSQIGSAVADVGAGGSNTDIQFNNAGVIGGNGNLTFDYALNVLTVSGNIISSNANLGNLAHANYFTGDGGLLSNIQASSGTASTVINSAQPNITSVGNLVNLQIGNVTSGTAGANGIAYFDGNGDLSLAGNIFVNANASVDALLVGNTNSNVRVDANGNLTVGHNFTVVGSANLITLLVGNTASNVYIDNAGDINAAGNITVGDGTGGSITGANSVSANYFIGDGSQLIGLSISGANVTGTVAEANYAAYAGNVTISQQPNITQLGTLVNVTIGSIGSNTYIDGTGNITTVNSIQGGTLISTGNIQGVYIQGVLTTVNQPNITSVGILTSLTIANSGIGNLSADNANLGNAVTANYFIGDGRYLSNIVATSGVANTVSNASQPNITSIGTLTGLNVAGVSNLGPIGNVIITGGSAGQYLQTDGAGDLSWVTIASATISSGSSNVIVNNDGNVTLSSDGNANVLLATGYGVVVNGNITVTGPGSMNALSLSSSAQSTSSTTGALTVVGGVGIGKNINGNGNLTINGTSTLSSLTLNGNLVAGNANFSQPVQFLSVADSTSKTTGAITVTGGVGVSGNINAGQGVTGVTLTGNLTTATQPNITSLGTLTSLTVSGSTTLANATTSNLTVNDTTNLGVVGNITITGGSSGQYLSTDGTGNLSWSSAASTNEIVNGTSNVTVNNDGNVTISSDSQANVVIVNSNAVNVYGTMNVTGVTTVNTLSITNTSVNSLQTAGGANIAGNLLTNGNLSIVGNTSLANTTIIGVVTVNGDSTFEQPLTVTSPTDSINPSTGAVTLTLGGLGVYGNINSGMGVTGVTLTGNITTTAQPNITQIGTLSNLTVTGNISSGNANLGNLTKSNYFSGTLDSLSYRQPNITQLGTLSNLSVTGNTSTGNLSVTGTTALGDVGNITITGGSSGQYLTTDGTGILSWTAVSTSTLSNGTSNLTVTNNGNIDLSVSGTANVVTISNTQVVITPTTSATSYTTGALLVDGGVGIAGNLYVNGIFNVNGDFQVGNLNTSGPVTHTGAVTFTQDTFFSNTDPATSTMTGAVQLSGGLGVQGNIFGGNIISAATTLLRNGENVPTFTSSATMPSSPLLGDEWYDRHNDRIYQYINDGTNYNWIDVSSGYIAANIQAQGGTVAVRDANGNIYANTFVGNTLDVANLTITGTTSISSIASGTTGQPVSNSTMTLIDQFPLSSYRSAKYIISAKNNDGYEAVEVLLIHDNMISFITTYGDISTGTVQDVITLSSDIVSGNACLYAQGSNSNTYVNFIATYVTD